jgi:hypothetical protein
MEKVGDCATEGRKGGGKKERKGEKELIRMGTSYFDASSIIFRGK